jgi:uncharacterized protein (TIGR03083 family)
MLPLDPDRYLEVVLADTAALADAGRRFPAAQVVACPGWDVEELIGHVGAVQGWVTLKLLGDPSLRRHRGAWTPPPPEDGDWPSWLVAISERLVEVLSTLPVETAFESWAGEQPVPFWQRRMAQEVTVHRWDGEAAAGAPNRIPVDVATDGIDELLVWFLGLQVDRTTLAATAPWSITFDPDDAEASWRVEVSATGVSVAESGGPSDLTVRGGASDLLLWGWNRPTQVGLAFDGNEAKAALWAEVLHV